MAADNGARPGPPEERSRRVFFALWPGAGVAGRLDEAGRQAHRICAGRRMRRETFHLTLAFIGNVAPLQVEQLKGIAGAVRAQPFELLLDRIECWRHNRIVWAGCSETPPPLARLASDLATRLRAADYLIDTRPFAVHVTLVRNAKCAPLAARAGIPWKVNDFVLVESMPDAGGAHYAVIRRWPLVEG